MQKKIKRKKEEIEIRNNADSMVYQTEKILKDIGDKVSQEEKSKVESKIEELKKALEGGDNVEEIKKKTEELTQEFYTISQKMYEQTESQGTESDTSGNDDDDVVDADFEVVDDDE